MLLVTLAFGATRMAKLHQHRGAPFAAFLFFYCAIRFGIEWLKPPFGDPAAGSLPVALYANLSAIQWVALFGMAWYILLLRIRLRAPSPH
jgi:prolipoprotein diacylglyceryltransferase